jgi:hypothetical protein
MTNRRSSWMTTNLGWSKWWTDSSKWWDTFDMNLRYSSGDEALYCHFDEVCFSVFVVQSKYEKPWTNCNKRFFWWFLCYEIWGITHQKFTKIGPPEIRKKRCYSKHAVFLAVFIWMDVWKWIIAYISVMHDVISTIIALSLPTYIE